MAPPPLGRLFPEARAERFAGGVEKMRALPSYYEAIAKAVGAEFLDIGKLTTPDGIDGFHLSSYGDRYRRCGEGQVDPAVIGLPLLRGRSRGFCKSQHGNLPST